MKKILISLIAFISIANAVESTNEHNSESTISGGGGSVPVGTGFTYQGELIESGQVVNTPRVFTFSLYDSSIGGTQLGPTLEYGSTIFPVDEPGHPITNGLFFMEDMNFGDQYDGTRVWIEITVRAPNLLNCGTPNPPCSIAEVLSPRQVIKAVPYAVQADYLGPIGATNGDILNFNGSSWIPSAPIISSDSQDLSLVGNTLNITSGSSATFTNWDSDVTDDFSGNYLDLINIPIQPWVISGMNINYSVGKVSIGTGFPGGVFTVNADNDIAFMAKINNSVKLIVDSNGGTSIGQFNTPPADGLRVLGKTILLNSIKIDSFIDPALIASSHFNRFAPDLILGASGPSNTTDEGVISSDPRYAGSDIWLMTNDSLVVRLDQDDNSVGDFQIRNGIDTTVFDINETGRVRQNGTTIHVSDRRLKKDIETLNYGLAEIMVLKPKAYNWRSHQQQYKSFGLIAQDVQKIMPEVIDIGTDKDSTLGLSYTELIPVLINAIQEQQIMIEALNKKIDRQNSVK